MKPEPEIFLSALELMKASPSAAIMVGDNEIDDIQGASALGIRTFLVDNSGSGKGYPFQCLSAYIGGGFAEDIPSQ